MKKNISNSRLKIYTLSLAFLILNCSFVIHDGNKIKSNTWQLLQSNDQVEIKYRYTECKLPSYGSHYENVYLLITNKTDQKIQLEWNTEYWYNGKCNGCEPGRTENHKIIILNPNQTIEGSCSEQCNRALLIPSKMLHLETKTELTDFNLRDLKVTPVLK
jgi:hypothetical protein